MTRHHSSSPEETQTMGRVFAASLQPGDVVGLAGELGSGKTQFVLGACQGLSVHGHVGSPTFTIVHEYPAAAVTVIHIDLYRISTEQELAELGLDEYFRPPFVSFIEWSDRMALHMPREHYWISFGYGEGPLDRIITIEKRPSHSGRKP